MPGRETQLLFDSPVARITRVRARRGLTHTSSVVERSSGHRLVLPLAGSFLATIGGRQTLIDPAATLLINGGEPYQLDLSDATGFTALVFALKAFDSTTTRHFATHLNFFAATTHVAIARALAGGSTAERCERLTLELFSAASESSRDSDSLPPPVERCRRILQVEDALAPRSLANLAKRSLSTRFHFTRSFRRTTGMSLQQYRNHLRLVGSLREIENSDRTLSTIALDAGFSTHSHFSTAFRAHFGLSPSALRSAIQSESAQVSESVAMSV